MRIKCIIVSLILFILSLPVCAAENIICDEFSFFRSGTAITSSQSGNINFSVKLSGAGKARLVIYYTDKDKLCDISVKTVSVSESIKEYSSSAVTVSSSAQKPFVYGLVWDSKNTPITAYRITPQNYASPEVLEAIEKFDLISDRGIVDFYIRLYDPESGGFCYSPSANDYPGYEGELEATATIMSSLPGMGLINGDFVSDKDVPDGFFEKMIEFYQSRQSEADGYWYDPLYGNSMIETKRERTSSKTLGNLKQIGGTPLYPTYLDRINGASLMASSLPAHFQSEAAYENWLRSKNWTNGTYATGNEITNSLTIAMQLGYEDIAAKVICEMQNPKTGCWGTDTITDDTTNGALKLSDAILKLGIKYPYPEQAVDTVIKFIENETEPANMCTIWNPLLLIYNIRKSHGNLFPLITQRKLDDKIVYLLEKTYDFLIQWRTPDGGYKYYMDVPVAEYGGVDACAGVDSVGRVEGNEDSAVIGSYLMRNSVYGAAGVNPIGAWGKYKDYFWEEIGKKMKLSNKKYEEGNSYTENFENVNTISDLYDTWGFLLQPQSDNRKLIYENGNRVLQVNTNVTVREKGGRDRFTTNFKIPKGDTYTAQFKFKIGTDTLRPSFNIYLGAKAVNLCILKDSVIGKDGSKMILAYRTNTDVGISASSTILSQSLEKGKWYTLKIEYSPKGKTDTKTVIYLDGGKLLETNAYYNGGFSERYPVKDIRFLKFEAYDRSCQASLFLDDISVTSK